MPDSHPYTSPICSPNRAPLQAGVGEETSNPASPKSKASTPSHPHFIQRVSCGVYVTVCPLACKQKAQPERSGARSGAAAPALRGPGPRALQVGAELSLSSATCCSWVQQLRSCKEGLCRRRALQHCLQHLPPPRNPPRPRASVPGSPRQARRRRPGTRGSCATAELGGGGNGRPGAAPPASSRGKSSLLLAKANTALFFSVRASAPGTPAATGQLQPRAQRPRGKRGACRAAPGQIPQTARHTGGARRPEGCPCGAKAANAPSTTPGLLRGRAA